MDYEIHESTYKDQAAITVQSESLAAQFLPHIGGKLASLVYKPLGLELLVQTPGSSYRLQPYDGDYVAGECSGFDDMFPTIDTCFYQAYPWKGTPIPDHGEVWSLPWECQVNEESLLLTAHGVRFPYRLAKAISITGSSTLMIHYHLTNLSPFGMDFMWAAHIMLNMEEGAQLQLPPQVKQVVNRLSFGGTLGQYGDVLDWPVCELADGQKRDLSHMRPKSVREADKYFVKGRMPAGWCALTYPRSNITLRLSFPQVQVPYLGILSNEGGWKDIYNIFIEPCTASFDDLNVSRLRGECSTLRASSTYEWSLAFSVSQIGSDDGR